jgi:hypothetical protein
VIDVNIDCAVKLIGTNCIIYPVNSKDLQHIWVSGCVASVLLLLLLASVVLMGPMLGAWSLWPACSRQAPCCPCLCATRQEVRVCSAAGIRIDHDKCGHITCFSLTTDTDVCLFVCLLYVGILQEYSLCVLLACLIPEVGVGYLGTGIMEL